MEFRTYTPQGWPKTVMRSERPESTHRPIKLGSNPDFDHFGRDLLVFYTGTMKQAQVFSHGRLGESGECPYQIPYPG